MAFGETYGEDAEGFIHVHHHQPIAKRGKAHDIDPITDLCPVCPNCHAVIHLTDPPRTAAEVRKLLKRT
jgi:predicted HNH restriction endonuclease